MTYVMTYVNIAKLFTISCQSNVERAGTKYSQEMLVLHAKNQNQLLIDVRL